MSRFWDDKFSESFYIYGEQPNVYLRGKLESLPVGKILFPAEGEGRNAVYAATLGWEVHAFDSSAVGKKKAEELAKKNGQEIHYVVSEAQDIAYRENSFDAMALIYAHFPAEIRRGIHRKLARFVKPGGTLIMEAFSKDQVKNQKGNPKAGGPKTSDMLYNLDEIKEDFQGFEFGEAVKTEIQLNEGNHHVGKGNVIRLLGTKK